MRADSLLLVDTNILVYAYEREKSRKKLIAASILSRCWSGEISLAVSNQNLSEFGYVSIRKGKLDIAQVRSIISDFIIFDGFKKIDYSGKTVLAALSFLDKFKMPVWDALLAATIEENGISCIYTENVKDFKAIGINAINPFS